MYFQIVAGWICQHGTRGYKGLCYYLRRDRDGTGNRQCWDSSWRLFGQSGTLQNRTSQPSMTCMWKPPELRHAMCYRSVGTEGRPWAGDKAGWLTDVSESGNRYSKPGGGCGRNRPWSQSITTVACWLASCKTPSTWPHRTRSSKPRTSSFNRVCTRLDPGPREEFGDQDSFRGSFLSPHSWGF